MKGFIANIERLSIDNTDFRRVLYTGPHSQLVLMSIPVGGEIGEEVHDVDQFFRVEKGNGIVVIDGVSHSVEDGSSAVVPAGAKHNVINTSTDSSLKLYTIYSPAHHRDGVVHPTKEAADADSESFDGTLSE